MKVIHSRFSDDDFDHREVQKLFIKLKMRHRMFNGARSGPAILAVIEDDDGRMYVFNGECASQVNFCPYTGQRATVLRDLS